MSNLEWPKIRLFGHLSSTLDINTTNLHVARLLLIDVGLAPYVCRELLQRAFYLKIAIFSTARSLSGTRSMPFSYLSIYDQCFSDHLNTPLRETSPIPPALNNHRFFQLYIFPCIRLIGSCISSISMTLINVFWSSTNLRNTACNVTSCHRIALFILSAQTARHTKSTLY